MTRRPKTVDQPTPSRTTPTPAQPPAAGKPAPTPTGKTAPTPTGKAPGAVPNPKGPTVTEEQIGQNLDPKSVKKK